MIFQNSEVLNIVAGSGTVTITLSDLIETYYLKTASATTLSANLVLSASGTPVEGQTIEFVLPGNITLSTYTFTIFGVNITAYQALKRGVLKLIWNSAGAGSWYPVYNPDFSQADILDDDSIVDVDIDKLSTSTGDGRILKTSSGAIVAYDSAASDRILIGNGSDVISAPVTGDISVAVSGSNAVTSIVAGVIVDADINSSAAIDRTKLASGTADHVLINDGSGVMSSEAQLTQERGGTNLDTSSSTGFPTISSGTWSVGAFTGNQRVDVSFDANRKGVYYVNFPFACTVTNIKIRATDTIEATNDGVINFKDNSGTNMVGGSLSSGSINITAASVIGDGFTSTITSNNTFTANQEMQITTSKVTSGGNCSIDITYTRLS